MKRFNCLVVVGLLLGAMAPAQAQLANDVERIDAASRQFVAAITARDINAMDAVWAHESYASFIGPLSTTVVVGWGGVRQAWQMRFGQFDRVTISTDQPHIRINGEAAWAVGMEKIELLSKDGKTMRFEAFVTNVFEKKGGQCFWWRTRRHPFSGRQNDYGPIVLFRTIHAPERSMTPSCSRLASVR